MKKNTQDTNKLCDENTRINDLKLLVQQFVSEREWEKYHSPKNIAISITLEAAELLEHFQWSPPAPEEINEQKKQEISDELADVLAYAFSLANKLDIDIATAMTEKMKKNRLKYPTEDFQGNWKKSKLGE